MLRAVVDVNVLISAHLELRGPSAQIYRAWLGGAFELVASGHLLDELQRVASRPHLARRLDPQAIPVVVARIRADAIVIDDPPPEPAIPADPKDDYLVGLARAADAMVIVTGDRHLLDVSVSSLGR